MQQIYMAMPEYSGQPVTGVFLKGEAVPADPQDERWQAYLRFCEDGHQALPFDPALEWIDDEWRVNAARARELFGLARLAAVDGVYQYLIEQRALAAGTSDPGELQARIAKRVVAQAVVAKTATEAQMLNLATEAKLRGMGETAEALAGKVIAKAVALDGVNARLDGLKRAAENAILATKTQAELDACVARFRAQIAAVVTDAGASE